MTPATKGKRETVSAAVTRAERDAVREVSRKTGKSVSELMRLYPLDVLIAWGEDGGPAEGDQ
jgi:hypothetical protein